MVQRTTVDNGCAAVTYPLSPMQQGMLFHSIGRAEPGVDIEQVICELDHPVSVPEFEQAWQLILRRHDALRTAFVWREGEEPRQYTRRADEVTLPIRVLDFASSRDAERVVETYLAGDRRAGFASLEGPLCRLALFQSADERAWFVFTYHHLVLDARGMYFLFKEAMELHDQLAAGQRVSLPATRPYRDYIAWLQTLDARRAEAFWREYLHGVAAPTNLPLPPPNDVVGAGDVGPGELAFRFTRRQTARLREAAKRHGVTLNTLLQGAWAVVLGRYAGEDDVIFGAVRACRHVPVEGASNLIGMLINTVPMRVRLSSAATVDHWLRDLRDQWVALRDFEHTPLMQVQTWSEVPAGQGLFDTLFNFQEPSWIGALRELGGVWQERRFDIRSQPGYPLALDLYGDRELLVRAFYERRRFAPDAVARVLGHFRNALLALADPRVDRVGEISLLDDFERRQLLHGFNATSRAYRRDACVHQLVASAAAARPDAVAVADALTTLTYRELNDRAERLAAVLRRLGVRRDVTAAVCMKRSTEMIVAWIAVLKAGGAFVPLDPDYPPDRLAFQLRDSGAPVLLSQPHLAGVLPACPAGVVQLELAPGASDEAAWGGGVDGAESGAALPTSLAYVIYTSGSTGEPKGVQITHRALMNLVDWHQHTYGVTAADRATQVASPAFDAAVWEVFPYLAAGASVHIPDEETRLSPSRLVHWLAEREITLCFLPTPVAEAALLEAWPAGMRLRALLTGGDQLQRPAPAGFPCPLVNHYGPTENTVVATAGVVRPETGLPPIGRPIANCAAYVLDREQRLAPLGVAGELYLGGESLADGYHQRPGLTAERFVSMPAAATALRLDADAPAVPRLYRTGDLVRWRSDGQLEFIGRLDNQVKIRGCRIELGEVQAALKRHPQVREALALARVDERGHNQLVGYVVCRTPAPAPEEIIATMRQAVPGYMVPAGVVVLEAWPLTANGKIDRRALPPLRPASRDAGWQAPRTAREQMVAQVWSDVLGRGPVGLNDSFFDLGGHSLLAAQAMTRLNASLGASVSVRVLFDHPTLAEFAAALDQHAAGAPRMPALRPKRRVQVADLEMAPPR